MGNFIDYKGRMRPVAQVIEMKKQDSQLKEQEIKEAQDATLRQLELEDAELAEAERIAKEKADAELAEAERIAKEKADAELIAKKSEEVIVPKNTASKKAK